MSTANGVINHMLQSLKNYKTTDKYKIKIASTADSVVNVSIDLNSINLIASKFKFTIRSKDLNYDIINNILLVNNYDIEDLYVTSSGASNIAMILDQFRDKLSIKHFVYYIKKEDEDLQRIDSSFKKFYGMTIDQIRIIAEDDDDHSIYYNLTMKNEGAIIRNFILHTPAFNVDLQWGINLPKDNFNSEDELLFFKLFEDIYQTADVPISKRLATFNYKFVDDNDENILR